MTEKPFSNDGSNTPQTEEIKGFKLSQEEVKICIEQFQNSMPEVKWSQKLISLAENDLGLLSQSRIQDILLSEEEKEKIKDRQGFKKAMRFVFQKTIAHEIPDDKAYADLSNKELLERHAFFGRIVALLAGFASQGLFKVILPAPVHIVAPLVGAGFYIVIQRIKEGVYDRTTYHTNRLLPHQVPQGWLLDRSLRKPANKKSTQPKKPQTLSESNRQKFTLKRITSTLALSLTPAFIVAGNSVFLATPNDHEAIMHWKVDNIKKQIYREATQDEKDLAELKKLYSLRAEELDQAYPTSNNLSASELVNNIELRIKLMNTGAELPNSAKDKEGKTVQTRINELSQKDPVFGQIQRQKALENKRNLIRIKLNNTKNLYVDKTGNTLNHDAAFEHKVKNDPSSIKSGYEEAQEKLEAQIKEMGGSYIENEMPLTADLRRKATFDKIYSPNDPAKTLRDYYTATEKKERKDTGEKLVQAIESNKYFGGSEKESAAYSELFSVGIHRLVERGEIPWGAIAEVSVILMIELVAVFNSLQAICDRRMWKYYYNEDVQFTAKQYASVLSNVIQMAMVRENIKFDAQVVEKNIRTLCRYGSLDSLRNIIEYQITNIFADEARKLLDITLKREKFTQDEQSHLNQINQNILENRANKELYPLELQALYAANQNLEEKIAEISRYELSKEAIDQQKITDQMAQQNQHQEEVNAKQKEANQKEVERIAIEKDEIKNMVQALNQDKEKNNIKLEKLQEKNIARTKIKAEEARNPDRVNSN